MNTKRARKATSSTAVVAVLAAAAMSGSLVQTIVIPLQGRFPELLHASPAETAWIVTVTLLSAAISTPIAGRLGDLYDKRRVIVGLLVAMLAGSVIIAASSLLVIVIIGRVLQGLAVGIIPVAISVLRDRLPPHKLPGAIALVSAALGVGGSLGLPLSAVVSQHLDWHLLFFLTAALAALNILGIMLVLPRSHVQTRLSFDLPGAVGLGIGLSGVLVAAANGNAWGWASLPTMALGLGGLAVLLLWIWYERHRDAPLVDLRLAVKRQVLFTNLASICVGFALFASNVAFPQMLQLPTTTGFGFGLDLIQTSLILVLQALGMMLVSPLAGKLTSRFGPKGMLAAGTILLSFSYTCAFFFHSHIWQMITINAVIGVGVGLGYSAMPALIMTAVQSTETAAANALNALMRSLGTAAAAAAVGAILAANVQTSAGEPHPSLEGFQWAFALGAITAAMAAILTLLIGPQANSESSQAQEHLALQPTSP